MRQLLQAAATDSATILQCSCSWEIAYKQQGEGQMRRGLTFKAALR